MIERLRGVVVDSDVEGVVVEVGGVGLRAEMSQTSLRDVTNAEGSVTVYCHLHVREDALQLFGFSSEEERQLFLKLISVSKIGPRLALAALSVRRPRDVRRAIAAGDVALFQSVPGIGKKTAERLVLELRDVMVQLEGHLAAGGAADGDGSELALARAALAELGMTAGEAERLLAGADPDTPVDELVRRALRGRR